MKVNVKLKVMVMVKVRVKVKVKVVKCHTAVVDCNVRMQWLVYRKRYQYVKVPS